MKTLSTFAVMSLILLSACNGGAPASAVSAQAVPLSTSDTNDTVANGSGTAGDPFQIATVAEFMAITANADYVLTADLDFTDITYVPIAVFNGVLNGAGHTLRNLSISNDTQAGLILYNTGTIENMVMTGAMISGLNVGAFAATSLGTISNVSFSGTIDSMGDYAGGVVGYLKGGTITNITVSGVINCEVSHPSCSDLGSIAGLVWGGSVSHAASTMVMPLGTESTNVGTLFGEVDTNMGAFTYSSVSASQGNSTEYFGFYGVN